MYKLNVFALFGIVFLSSILLGSGMYSNQIFAQQENEAEVEVDIEQENKCKKDTECENENEINNSLTITTTQGQEQEQPEIPTCETCFTDILSEEELDAFITEFAIHVKGPVTTLEELCEFIEQAQGDIQLNIVLLESANAALLTEDQYIDLIECLQDAGLDVDFTIT